LYLVIIILSSIPSQFDIIVILFQKIVIFLLLSNYNILLLSLK